MASPSEFNRRVGVLGTKVTKGADKVVRKVALAVDQAVVLQTPVDTGRARANWLAALNIPNFSASDATDKGGGSAMAQAASVAAAYNGDKDVAIHITNNLPYIGALDEGTSAQAPAGFVRLSVLRGVGAVQGARILEG